MNLKCSFRSNFERVASFILIILCIFLFSLSFVSATLSVRNIVSASGFPDFRAATDTVGVNVTSTSNVTIDGVPCIKKSTTVYTCIVSDTIDSAVASYDIENDEGNTASASIKVDNNVGSMSYTLMNSQNSVNLAYDVQDLGFDNNDACSGIKTLNVYSDSSLINTVDVAGASGVCMYSGSMNLSLSSSGLKNISLEAVDNVGNSRKTPAKEVMIDLSAPKISNGLAVKYAGTDDDISVIGGSASFYADIYFTITEDTLSTVTVDLSGSNNNPSIQYMYMSLDVPISDCELNETGASRVYTCRVSNIPLKLSGSTLNVNVTANDSYNNVGKALLSKTFTVDSIIPKASITTDTCDTNGKCYVHNGVNSVIVQLNKKNFNNRYVFIDIPGSTFGTNRVENCTNGICTAYIPLICSNGEAVSASIGSYAGMPSQDDAGNLIEDYSTQLYCDNTAPKITSINVTGEASAVLKDIISGSTITITANVLESESDFLTAYAYLDKLKNATQEGDCTRADLQSFNCVWTVSNIASGPYDVNLVINVSDSANNTASKPYKFRVYGYKSDNETPDNLAIALRNVNPEKINRAVLGMATQNNIPYYAYATYDISVVHGKDVELLYQTLDISKCMYTGILGTDSASVIFSGARLSNPYSDVDSVGRIDFLFKTGLDTIVNSIDDDFTITCNISATVREGNLVYKKTQVLPLVMQFHTVGTKLCSQGSDCTPGAMLGDKIKDAEDNFWVKNEFMGLLNNWIPKLQSICKVRDYLSMGVFAGNVLEGIGNSVDIAYGSGSSNAAVPGFSISKTLGGLDSCLSGASKSADPNAKGNTCGFVGDVCNFLNCNIAEKFNGSDVSSKIPDLFSGDKFGSNFGEEAMYAIKRNAQVPDVSNSIIMAAKTGCFPAMYYNLNKYRQAECNYLYCLKTASYAGSDVSMCDKVKYSQYCTYVVGELFELPTLAGLPSFRNYMNNAADLVKNSFPLAAASALKNTVCKEFIDFNTGKATMPPSTTAEMTAKFYGCQIPLQIARVTDLSMRSRKSSIFVYPAVTDMCTYAKCVGQANCVATPDIWDTLNKVTISPNNQSILAPNTKADANKAIVENQKAINQLRSLRVMEYAQSLHPQPSWFKQEDYDKAVADAQKNGLVKKDYGYTGVTPTEIAADPTVKNIQTKDDSAYAVLTDMEAKANAAGGIKELSDADQKKLSDARATTDSLDKQLSDAQASAGSKILASKSTGEISSSITALQGCAKKGVSPDDCMKSMTPLITSGADVIGVTEAQSKAFTISQKDYDNLPADKKIEIDNTRTGTYAQLNELNSILYANGGYDGLSTEIVTYNGKQVPYSSLLANRKTLLSTMGLCGPGTANPDCDAYNQELAKKSAKEMEPFNKDISSKLDEAKKLQVNNVKAYAAFQSAETFGKTLFTALQYARAAGIFRNMFSWYETGIMGKLSSYLDADKWKDSICNPDTVVSIGGPSSEGSVISCTTGNCQPVLTYATQRTELSYPANSTNPDGTKYDIYTVVYFINSGDLMGQSITYNIYFKGDGVMLQGYAKDVPLTAFGIRQDKRVFKSTKMYTQMCVRFNEAFPLGNVITAKDEYCRSINSEVLDNGSPWVDPSKIVAATDNGTNDGTIATKGVLD